MNPAFVTRIQIRNFKSIASCDVRLGKLVFVVGPNGSGKSNFLDVLRFVADSLRTSLDHALRERGGIKEVRRRSGGHPTHFHLQLDFTLASGQNGYYAFSIGARPQGGYEVQQEKCIVRPPQVLSPEEYYEVQSGQVVKASVPSPPAAAIDRLYLVNASGLAPFRPVFEAFSRMGFYNLSPKEIREPQPPDAGELLLRDGRNIASVLGQLKSKNPALKLRIEEYLELVVPGVRSVDVKAIGTRETLEFRQVVAGAKEPWYFLASNMSDGTLRVLGILVALFQSGNGAEHKVPLVGIEEPEMALHPGAAGVLLDSLRDASQGTQVLVTSHSPDLLDDDKIDADSILAVSAANGITSIGPLDKAGRSALIDRLYTAGELLRLNQVEPDPDFCREVPSKQLHFLDDENTK